MKKNFTLAQKHISLTTGDVIRMLRELKGWTQEKLAALSGVNAKNLSLLENNKVDIGKKRAVQIANACGVHPSIIMFPEYEAELIHMVA